LDEEDVCQHIYKKPRKKVATQATTPIPTQPLASLSSDETVVPQPDSNQRGPKEVQPEARSTLTNTANLLDASQEETQNADPNARVTTRKPITTEPTTTLESTWTIPQIEEEARSLRCVMDRCGLPESHPIGHLPELNDVVTLRSLKRLVLGEWLDDVVINSYFSLLARRYKHAGFLSSYFASKLVVDSNQLVNSWSSVKKILSDMKSRKIDLVLIPIHLSSHWVLAVLWRCGSRWTLFDSLGRSSTGKGDRWFEKMKTKLSSWLRTNLPSSREGSAKIVWPYDSAISNEKPHQDLSTDTSNCGVFVCYYAESVCQGHSITEIANRVPTIDEMTNYRSLIALRLSRGLPLSFSGDSNNKPPMPKSATNRTSTSLPKPPAIPTPSINIRSKLFSPKKRKRSAIDGPNNLVTVAPKSLAMVDPGSSSVAKIPLLRPPVQSVQSSSQSEFQTEILTDHLLIVDGPSVNNQKEGLDTILSTLLSDETIELKTTVQEQVPRGMSGIDLSLRIPIQSIEDLLSAF